MLLADEGDARRGYAINALDTFDDFVAEAVRLPTRVTRRLRTFRPDECATRP